MEGARILSSTDASVAFAGVPLGGTVTTASDDAIWWKPEGGSLYPDRRGRQ